MQDFLFLMCAFINLTDSVCAVLCFLYGQKKINQQKRLSCFIDWLDGFVSFSFLPVLLSIGCQNEITLMMSGGEWRGNKITKSVLCPVVLSQWGKSNILNLYPPILFVKLSASVYPVLTFDVTTWVAVCWLKIAVKKQDLVGAHFSPVVVASAVFGFIFDHSSSLVWEKKLCVLSLYACLSVCVCAPVKQTI